MGGGTGLVCPPPLAAPLQVLVERGEVVASYGQLSIEHKKNVHMYLKAFRGRGGIGGNMQGGTRSCASLSVLASGPEGPLRTTHT